MTTSVSLAAAEDIRSALRCMFQFFVGAGVLSANPFPRDPRGLRTVYCGSSAPHAVVSAPMRTELDVDEGDPLEAVIGQIDSQIVTLTAKITSLKCKSEKLCQRRDKLAADLKRAIASSQHQALTLSLADVMRMSDVEVIEAFKRVRWNKSGGRPVCSRCGCIELYDCKAESLWKCKGCGYRFSVTSGTIFAGRKLPLREILAAIAIVTNGAKRHSALQLSRDLDVQYKTASALSHKIREATDLKSTGQIVSGGIDVFGRNGWWSGCRNIGETQ